MADVKFTPAPWVADINVPYPTIFTKGGRTRWVSLTDAGMVADDDIYDFSEDGDKMAAYNADALLIAAAPDLYSASTKALEYMEESEFAGWSGWKEIIAEMRAALAKARGESAQAATKGG